MYEWFSSASELVLGRFCSERCCRRHVHSRTSERWRSTSSFYLDLNFGRWEMLCGVRVAHIQQRKHALARAGFTAHTRQRELYYAISGTFVLLNFVYYEVGGDDLFNFFCFSICPWKRLLGDSPFDQSDPRSKLSWIREARIAKNKQNSLLLALDSPGTIANSRVHIFRKKNRDV